MAKRTTSTIPTYKRKRQRSLPARILGWLVRLVFAIILISVLWVLAYRFVPPPITATMVGDFIAGRGVTKDWMGIDQIDRDMVRAAIAAEDSKFCSHNGFDFDAIEQAMQRNASGGRIRGGSTISQQTAKNAFLWQGGGYVRKGVEAWFTVLIEAMWTKRRIMEVYLNVAETGIGTYGVNAGSERYYGHDASAMSRTEAARIAAILDSGQSRGRAGALSASAILAVAGLVIVGISPLRAVTRAQSQAAGSASFEVASIRRNSSGDMRASIQALPGGYRAVNAPLRLLIRDAYALQGFQLVGGPSWLDSERFDILAKADGSPTPEQERLMLRTLLAERFALSVHTEARELPLYAMVMARVDGRPGPRLRRTGADCADAPVWQGTGPAPSRDPNNPCSSAGPGSGGGMRFRGVTLEAFATFLATPAQRPVIDRTGLSGLFDIELELTAELGPPPPPPGEADRVNRAFAPSIFTALQEQLGLKLDSRRGPIDVIVIDRVEPLVPN